jgi:hypothetical protein
MLFANLFGLPTQPNTDYPTPAQGGFCVSADRKPDHYTDNPRRLGWNGGNESVDLAIPLPASLMVESGKASDAGRIGEAKHISGFTYFNNRRSRSRSRGCLT